MKHPWEWLAFLLAIVGIDVYYYRSQKRPTLSFTVKVINQDPVMRSIMWALWTWLAYHWFFEKD